MKFEKIIQAGMTSSGTTVIYQVLKHLLGDKRVIKKHDFVVGDTKTGLVVNVRDFRCLCMTTFRRYHVTPSREAIQDWFDTNFLSQFSWFSKFRTVKQHKILWLKYNDYFENFEFLFNALSKFLDITIPEQQKQHIAKDCCIAKNRQRQKPFSGFKRGQADPYYRIFGDHCGQGLVESWRTLPEDLQIYITQLTAPYLKEYGFELGVAI